MSVQLKNVSNDYWVAELVASAFGLQNAISGNAPKISNYPSFSIILKHINLGVTIEGIFSKNEYELPKESIREMIANAVTHRNYAENASVQVAVYDDRIEVTSPGMLYGGITLKEVLSGASRIRNKAIATIFAQMHVIDDWGTGIQKIIDGCHNYGISDSEFLELGTSFRVNLYRDNNPLLKKNGKKGLEPTGSNRGSNDSNRDSNDADEVARILGCIEQNPSVTYEEISLTVGIKRRTVQRRLQELKEAGTIRRVGGTRGYWEVVK